MVAAVIVESDDSVPPGFVNSVGGCCEVKKCCSKSDQDAYTCKSSSKCENMKIDLIDVKSTLVTDAAPTASNLDLKCKESKKNRTGCSSVMSSIKMIFSSCVKPQAALKNDSKEKSTEAAEQVMSSQLESLDISDDSSSDENLIDIDEDLEESLPISSISTAPASVIKLLSPSKFNEARLEFHRRRILEMLNLYSGVIDRDPLVLELRPNDVGKKCLILDLDETLIHSQFQRVPNPDLIVPMMLEPDNHRPIYVSKRPRVDEFLEFVGKHFEVIIFTASLASYADPVIDALDKTGTISHRLYRESCLYVDGLYLKDLSRINRPLDQLILVDNAPFSYLLQPENGVAVQSWFSDPDDDELMGRLKPALEDMIQSSDVFAWKKNWEHCIHHLMHEDDNN